ncbi:hypothetical protein NW754_009526 [Fusarium falciforme]|nr:hypothetical protein NW754_009526 [Fusarium falciforme]
MGRFLPDLRDRKIVDRAMCWCTDTADANLLICEHPKWKNLILATGDSGHTFKLLPNIGKHVVELLEGILPQQLAESWRWRPGATRSSLDVQLQPKILQRCQAGNLMHDCKSWGWTNFCACKAA